MIMDVSLERFYSISTSTCHSIANYLFKLGGPSFKEYNIYYLQSFTKKMNYLTLMPNCYYGNSNQLAPAINPFMFSQNHVNTKNVLNFLKTALTISLNNYQQKNQQSAIQPLSTPLPTKNDSHSQELSPKALELLQSYEENKEIPLFNIETLQKAATERDGTSQGNMKSKEIVVQTEDELLFEDKQKQAKKVQSAKKRGKKVKEDVEGTFVVPIPSIDLIETAYLPLFSLERQELSNKRQDLLLRKVGDWSSTLKGKKDKRQIRNLTN